jgi:hypothetical protein
LIRLVQVYAGVAAVAFRRLETAHLGFSCGALS